MTDYPRPPDWKNGWHREREYHGFLSKAEIFEAGADAIYPWAFEQGKVEGRKGGKEK